MSAPRKAVALLRLSPKPKPSKSRPNPRPAVELGLDAQRAAIATWAKRECVELVAEYVESETSGGRTLASRVELLAAIACVEREGATFLVVAVRDRLARSMPVACAIEAMVADAGASIATANGVGDGDDPEAVLMRRVLDAIAEFERGVIRRRTRNALAVKRSRGERIGRHAPFGTSFDGSRVVPDVRELSVMAEAQRLSTEGHSLRWIATALSDAGMHPRGGQGARWHPKTVAALLSQNETHRAQAV